MADCNNRVHHDTPTKSRVRGAIDYMEARGILHSKEDVFRFNAVSHRQGWAMISDGSIDRRHHNAEGPEKRGRKSAITNQQLKEMDKIIKEEGFEARKMSWLELGFEAGIEGLTSQTISRAMGNTMNYHKCIACQKKWEWCTVIKERYPEPEMWFKVQFSDKVHWAVGPQGSLYIIQKPGERYCNDCIQQQEKKDNYEKKELKKVHAWVAVGYNFKSSLTFYEISSNTNGKMTQKGYINQILEPVVKPWLNEGQDFVLEEDGDSGHGPGKSNIVCTWKEKNKLKHYFNCHSSPDLSPIENCWQPPKQYVKKYPHWDEGDTRELALEGWEKVNQEFINKRVITMPQRLQDCIDMDGQMTGW
ncbi:hypothetical protein EJ02DRAFT_477424 [Clathrospora elynae]|uniref:Uncharacterized protein n=1 Tax=Clathrospora elynae TaxID=706981 RepID=A0A6A5S9I3_9PLEO|nr:hypothetical protein EJ02DRAFT_477424 [Clathrospora elynae]